MGSTDKGTQKTACLLAGTLRGWGEGADQASGAPIKPPLQDFRFSGQLLSLRQDLLALGVGTWGVMSMGGAAPGSRLIELGIRGQCLREGGKGAGIQPFLPF